MWKRDAIFRIHISEEGKTRDEEVGKTSFIVGRGTSSDIQIAGPSVSRSHLNVELKDGQIWIKDLGSAAGTILNGDKLEANKAELYEPGDKVNLGPSHIVLTF